MEMALVNTACLYKWMMGVKADFFVRGTFAEISNADIWMNKATFCGYQATSVILRILNDNKIMS